MICFNWKEAVLSWTKKKQGNKKEKLTESLHLTVKIARRSNNKIDLRKLRVNKITGHRNQPQSQGSLLPSPMERERETLENAGHVSPRRKKKPGRVPVSESFVPSNFCQHQYDADFSRSRSAMFCSCLQSAIVNSSYWNINIKPKQVKCLEVVYRGKDTVGFLPTGYGKSIVFHLLPGIFLAKVSSRSTEQSPIHPVIIVISPLNALISDQIRRSTEGKVKAAILNVRKGRNGEDLEFNDTSVANSSWLKDARYDIIFTHPEAVLPCKKGMELFQSQPYQQYV